MWIFIVIAVSLIGRVSLYLPEWRVCELHTGETGICRGFSQCKWLLDSLKARNMTNKDIRACSSKHEMVLNNSEIFHVKLFGEIGPRPKHWKFYCFQKKGRREVIICCKNDQLNPSILIPTRSPLFDNRKCVFPVEGTNLTPPTVPVPEIPDRTKSCGGCKARTCFRYSVNQFYEPRKYLVVANGKRAERYEVPHMVALGYRNEQKGYDFDCGGSLIADKWVVTASHCVPNERKPVIVRMGTLYPNEDVGGFIDRTITRIIRHPNYSYLKEINDIALIEFEGHVDYDPELHPACIRTDVDDLPENTEMMIAGWGRDPFDEWEFIGRKRSKVLLKATVFTVPLHTCNQTFAEYNGMPKSQSQLCALNRKTCSDACEGDSGGPIFTRDILGDYNEFTAHGVVSFGISCASALPGIYTRIASYIDWIESIVGQ